MNIFRRRPELKPQPDAKLQYYGFKRMKVELKHNIDFERRIRLLAARAIVNQAVNRSAMPPGDYKIKFLPAEWGASVVIDPRVWPADNVAFKIFADDGHRVGVYRHKSPISAVETQRLDMGASPHEKADLLHADMPQVIQGLEESRSFQFLPGQKADFDVLHKLAAERWAQRQALIMELCGNSEEKKERLESLFSAAKDIISEINSLRCSNDSCAKHAPTMPVEAAGMFPMREKGAQDIIAFYSNGGRLAEWVGRYAQAIRKTMGVDYLEFTAASAMRELEIALDRIHSESMNKGKFLEHYAFFNSRMHRIHELVDSTDRTLDRLLLKRTYENNDLLSICALADTRQELLALFKELYAEAKKFKEAAHHAEHVKAIVVTMACNLCRIGREEAGLWGELVSHRDFKKALNDRIRNLKNELSCLRNVIKFDRRLAAENGDNEKAGKLEDAVQRCDKLLGRVSSFCKASNAEADAISRLEGLTKLGTQDRKARISALEARLVSEIFDNVYLVSPSIHSILTEAYHESRTHQSYKRRRPLCQNLHYYLPTSELLFAEMETTGKSGASARMKTFLSENHQLYALLEKHGLRDEIMAHMGKFLHIKERPFDIESDAMAIQQSGHAGRKLQMRYKLGRDASGARQLTLSPATSEEAGLLGMAEGESLRVPVGDYLPHEENFSRDKGLSEELYGDKFDLDFILQQVQTKQQSLGEIYHEVYVLASTDLPRFRMVQQNLRTKSLDTAHFVYLLTQKRTLTGCVSSQLGENLPLAIGKEGEENHFLELIGRFYPNFMGEASETDDFLLQKTAHMLLKELNRTMPYWVGRCVEKMKEASGQQAQHGGSAGAEPSGSSAAG